MARRLPEAWSFGAGNNVLEVNNGTDLHGATISGDVVLDMTTTTGSTVTMTSAEEWLFDDGGAMTAAAHSTQHYQHH